MRILTRYVLAELIKVFLVSVIGLTLLMLIGGVVREAVAQSLPLGQVMRLIPFILPDALRIAVPVTFLLATTVVYGRMAGANEVTALKALGLHPRIILVPALIVAFLLSLTTVWLNDLAVSWGRNGTRRVVIEAVEEIIYSMLRAQHTYSSSNFAINVKRVEDRRLIRPTLSIQAHGSSPAITVMAEEAELLADHRARVLRITLRNGTLSVAGKVSVQFPEYERDIPLDDASRAQSNATILPSWLPLRVIPEEIARQRKEIERYENKMAARAALQMLCGDFDGLASPQWEGYAQNLANERGRLYRLQAEPHRRWSAGFSCLCFACIGAPMAIRLRNRDFLTIFFLCFVPILIVYYPLLVFGADAAKNGSLPPYAVWVGNLLLLCWGAWVLKRVIRY